MAMSAVIRIDGPAGAQAAGDAGHLALVHRRPAAVEVVGAAVEPEPARQLPAEQDVAEELGSIAGPVGRRVIGQGDIQRGPVDLSPGPVAEPAGPLGEQHPVEDEIELDEQHRLLAEMRQRRGAEPAAEDVVIESAIEPLEQRRSE